MNAPSYNAKPFINKDKVVYNNSQPGPLYRYAPACVRSEPFVKSLFTEPTQVKHLKYVPLLRRLLILATNIRLGRESLPETKPLAY
jgi:hypothetical protein